MHAYELTFDEILTARSIFAKHAEANVTTVHQLRSILSDLGQYPTQAELDLVLDVFDHKVAFEDLSRYLVFLKRNFMKPEPKDADTVRAFVALGGKADRHGDINADDLRTACRKFNLTIDIEKMLKEVDEDGSGSIEYEEFRSMWENQAEQDVDVAVDGPLKPRREAVQFHGADDETLSESEFLQHLRHFLTAHSRPQEAAAQLSRNPSLRRKSTKPSDHRKSMFRLPPLPAAAPVKDKDTAEQESEEEDEKPRAAELVTQRQSVGHVSDPAYQKYMMTDPLVVGTYKASKATPRGPRNLPPMQQSPRATTAMKSSTGSPRGASSRGTSPRGTGRK